MIEALYQCSDEGLFFTEWQQNYETLANMSLARSHQRKTRYAWPEKYKNQAV
jgi:hypothetical protein